MKCSFVEKVDYFKSYSQYGLALIITIYSRTGLTLWLTFKGSSAGYRQEHYREMATIRKPQSAGLTIK